jgi:hypothetical protein
MVRLLFQTVEGDKNKKAKKNRRVCRRFLGGQDVFFGYVQISLPPQALENQK